VAIDLDPLAVSQTRGSADLAGVGAMVEARCQPIATLGPADLTGVTLLANIPAAAHHALLETLAGSPAAAVLSGLRRAEAAGTLAGYRAVGMHRVRSMRIGRFECHVLAGPE
jgi:hypothetical protein